MAANAYGYCSVCGTCITLYARSKSTTHEGLCRPMSHRRKRVVGKGPDAKTILERCPGCDVLVPAQMPRHKIARGEPLADWEKR